MSLRASEPANSEHESASNEEEASEEEASYEEEEVRRDSAKPPFPLPSEKQRDVIPMALTPAFPLDENDESEAEGSTQGVEQKMLPSPAQKKRKSRPSVMPVGAARKKRTNARREKIPISDNESNAKMRFERLWSEEDEITVLTGLLEYTPRNKADMKVFYNVIKDSLRIQVSQSQLVKKIWKLKKKYTNKARRGKNGADPKFTNPHEKKIFELSKKMWAKNEESSREVIGYEKSLGSCVRGFELIEGSKKAELEDQRKTLETAELELYVERAKLEAKLAELDSKQAELSRKRTQLAVEERILVLEAYKSSTN